MYTYIRYINRKRYIHMYMCTCSYIQIHIQMQIRMHIPMYECIYITDGCHVGQTGAGWSISITPLPTPPSGNSRMLEEKGVYE